MILRAAIYDPYLDTLGGGERYCLTVAEALIKKGYVVDMFWSGEKDIIQKAQNRFNLDISKINIVPDIFKYQPKDIETISDCESLTKVAHHQKNKQAQSISNFVSKIKVTSQYDLIFYISDWSLPFLFSKNNLLHVQVPFLTNNSLKTKLLNKIKMLFIKQIICNSKFTSQFAINQFDDKCRVLYPPVDIEKFTPNISKENIILSVGRFDNILNSKKQDILIESFIELYGQGNISDWKLILTGGSLTSPDENTYLHHLKNIAKDYPIEFYPNPSFTEIKNLYEKSKIYWHAAGYNVNQQEHPENTEHFGMAPVESMAAGLVPLVVNKGGLNEIFEDRISGYLWDTPSELVSKTQTLIQDPKLLESLSSQAIIRCRLFSKETFVNNLEKIINI